ncbi:kinase-like domain-containing protein [Jimgerdemannia flammicorona]|uniref:Kinase-like domain-containing protein n=1 Tax=Jimgerdemannia flammicorona TaxID=994334 RepID=A0A433DCL2_9FUNG|nr:kinase-like domain-containing protein [Jimgerdemannia flammicorona]
MNASDPYSIHITREIDPLPRIPLLPTDSVTLGNLLGQGGFGRVYRGTLRGMTVAVKLMSAPRLSTEVERVVQNELRLLVRLRHCNFVVQVLGYYRTDDSTVAIARICGDIAKAVEFVHAEGIIHGDLKATNILLDRFLTPKITDFGISRAFTTLIGERLRHPDKRFTHQESVLSDIYGYGLIVWEVATDGMQPYAGMNDMTLNIAKISDEISDDNQLQYVGDLPDDTPQVFRDIVCQCLSVDPTLRPSLASVQNTLDAYMATAPAPRALYEVDSTGLAPAAAASDSGWLPISPTVPSADIGVNELSTLSRQQREAFGVAMYYYQEGKLVQAMEYFQVPELRDHSITLRMLGHCHIAAGNDPVEAFQCFKRSSEGGDAKGQLALAWCFDNRYGTWQDLASAFEWYVSRQRPSFGNRGGWSIYWRPLATRVFMPNESEVLAKTLLESVRSGNIRARRLFALLYYSGKLDGIHEGLEIHTNDKLFLGLVEYSIVGNKEAQSEVHRLIKASPPDCQIGRCYYFGAGVDQDDKRSFSWCNFVAQFNLSCLHTGGRGTDKNLKEAFYWCEKAAEAGSLLAQMGLSWMYMNGAGIEKDPDAAFQWVSRAAQAGNANAQNSLGYCYFAGVEVDQDYGMAARWYLRAAEAGSLQGMKNIGVCYISGRGAKADVAAAFRWFSKAASAGYSDTQCNLAFCYITKRDVDTGIWWLRKYAMGSPEAALEVFKNADNDGFVNKGHLMEAYLLLEKVIKEGGVAAGWNPPKVQPKVPPNEMTKEIAKELSQTTDLSVKTRQNWFSKLVRK